VEARVASISAREIALRVLIEYPGRSKPDDLLEELLRAHDPERRERALATQLVSGTIKWRNKLDHVIKELSHKKRVVSSAVLNILRLSLYQLMFLDKVPDYGATNEGVKLAKEHADPHQASYVNAILRQYLRNKDNIAFPDIQKDPAKHISVVYSHPVWLVKRWLKRLSVEEVVDLARANNRIPAIGLRVNELRTTMPEVGDMMAGEGAEIISSGFGGARHLYVRGVSPVEATRAHGMGWVQVQDASSTLVALALSPSEGSRVVDLCSAPGGKATHLYEIAQGRAAMVAADVSLPRLRMVRKNAGRLGHDGMMYAVCDGRQPAFKDIDFLLVDAPCTGLGVLARRWDLRWTKREHDIARMAAFQRTLLDAAIGIVRKGGIVVYSTCSIEPEENQEVVEAVMAKRGDLRLLDIGQFVDESVVKENGMMQTLPHVHGVDGIFAARLERL
jgi:16S rRNA (cytosine967-C5)-methyltransferase